jgi:methionyl aminopeptidase
MAGIAAAVPGAHVEDVSGAVEDVAIEGGAISCAVRRPRHRHQDARGSASPQLPGGVPAGSWKPGVCIAIEPMLALGSADVETLADGWTVVTTDHSLAAHFEHTIA